MPNKLTDTDVKKGLECCANLEACEKCPMCSFEKYDTDTCEHQIMLYSLSLINRQKAEIERLENKVKGFEKIRRAYQRFIYESMPNIQTALDKVLKELVGENDEKI